MKNIKKLWILIIFVFTTFTLISCKDKKEGVKAEAEKTDGQASDISPTQVGYAMGIIVGRTVKENELEIDQKEFLKGFKLASADKFEPAEWTDAQMILTQALQTAHTKKLAKMLKEGKDFLENNKKKDGIQVTESGLQYEVIKKSESNIHAKETDTVEVHYVGKLLNGNVFDDSYKQEKPVKIDLARVIPAWREGVPLMTVGSKYKFYVSPELGYGEQGVRNQTTGQVIIPGNAALIFEIELINVDQSKESSVKN